MTLRERVAWISVVTSTVIFGWYFWSVWADFAARALDGDELFWRFLKCAAVAFIIMLPASLIGAYLGGEKFDPPPDELERSIEARSNRIGLAVLEASLVVIVLSSKWITDIARVDFPVDPAGATAIALINLVLFAAAAAAVLREVLTIIQYRRYA